jgi:Ca2+/Na+ antiporter
VFSVLLLYWRSRKGELNKRDGAALIGAYAVFLAIQILLEASSA